MNGWRQRTVEVLFVSTEAIAWYLMLHVGATAMEQTFLLDLGDRLQASIDGQQVADPGRAAQAVELVHRAVATGHGPPLIVVLLAGLGAFWLMRLLVRYHFDGALGAIVLLAGSVLGLNVLLHVALAGDLNVWDSGEIARLLGTSNGALAGRVDLDAFVAHPSLGSPHGSTLGFVFVGMVMMWIRFALAGRSTVTFERVLRSFTFGFVAVLIGIVLARIEGVGQITVFAVPHFALGTLALAVANNARAITPAEGARRTGPWVAAVGGTVAVLTAMAMLLGLLAFLNVGVVLDAIGTVAARVVGFVLIIVMTPVFWVVERLLRLLLPKGIDQLLANLQQTPASPPSEAAKQAGGPLVPQWAQNGLKFLAVVAIVWLVYRAALLIMRRRREIAAPVDEVRSRTAGGVGLGALLRGLFPRAVRGLSGDWMRRQAIYRLYGRAVAGADARGFRYLPGETPLEFSTRASRLMAAPYAPIGEAFDRARYGRHYPSPDAVRTLESNLAAWEAATPPTEELRQRLAGSVPLSETAEFELRVAQRNRSRLRGRLPPPPPTETEF